MSDAPASQRREIENDAGLTLVADDRTVRLLCDDQEVAHHARSWGKRQRIEEPQHREDLLKQKRGAQPARGRERLRAAVPAIDDLFACWVDAGRNVGSMTARTMRLLDLYDDAMLRDAVTEALQRGVSDPGALAQLCEQQRHKERAPIPIEVSLGDHVPDCDVIPHALEKYDVDYE